MCPKDEFLINLDYLNNFTNIFVPAYIIANDSTYLNYKIHTLLTSGLSSTSNQGQALQVMFQPSPAKSPFKINTASNATTLPFSPLKAGTSNMYSPFKESSLSPFKLLNQSPSKGTFDDWDKELFSCLDENLFGPGAISDSVLDELLKSPQGKAFLESRNSPLKNIGNSSVVRQLRISPENNRHKGRHFQSLNDQSSDLFTVDTSLVKHEAFEYTEIKSESTLEDHMYGQQTHGFANSLSAVDPNKMSATPMKPGFTYVENAPKRKLSMRAVGGLMTEDSFTIDELNRNENVINLSSQMRHTWPSKERLKFARQQFKEILEKAVANEIQMIEQERHRKANQTMVEKTVVKPKENVRGVKDTKGKTKKTKTYRKKKKDTAQSKSVMSKQASKGKHKPPVIHKNLFSVPIPDFKDPGWYPSDDEEGSMWTGPPPFYTKTGLDMYDDDEDESSDEEVSTFKYETISGRRVNLKRPRLR